MIAASGGGGQAAVISLKLASDPGNPGVSKALADMHLGNHEEALQTAHWAVRLQPKFWLGRQVLAACLSACNQMPEAGKATAELKRDYPGLGADEFAAWFPYANPDDGNLIAEALHRAGWP